MHQFVQGHLEVLMKQSGWCKKYLLCQHHHSNAEPSWKPLSWEELVIFMEKETAKILTRPTIDF